MKSCAAVLILAVILMGLSIAIAVYRNAANPTKEKRPTAISERIALRKELALQRDSPF